MKEARRDNEVMSVYHMIQYIWEDHEPWWRMYLASQRDETAALANLARMCRRLAYAFGFSRCRASSNKLAQQDLEALQATFAASFWERFEQWPTSHIVNCDETGIFLDMPPPATSWPSVASPPRLTRARRTRPGLQLYWLLRLAVL
jgi:hypothetical protein